MKKLMVLAAIAAVALGAKAEYAVKYGYFGNAKGDESPATANLKYYQVYVIQYASGGDAALAYVKDQGLAGIQKAALAQFDSTYEFNKWHVSYDQYVLADGSASPASLNIPLSEAYAVVYYGQGDAVSEFMVLGNSNAEFYSFDDTNIKGYKSGWQSVPEPTSGLLLLLGMAGLALKRKLNG